MKVVISQGQNGLINIKSGNMVKKSGKIGNQYSLSSATGRADTDHAKVVISQGLNCLTNIKSGKIW